MWRRSMYCRLDAMGELSMNCMLVKTRSKILSDRMARHTFMLLRLKYRRWDLLEVKFSLLTVAS